VADKLADERAVVTLHADECRSCEWHPATQSGFMVADDAGHWQPGYVGTVP